MCPPEHELIPQDIFHIAQNKRFGRHFHHSVILPMSGADGVTVLTGRKGLIKKLIEKLPVFNGLGFIKDTDAC